MALLDLPLDILRYLIIPHLDSLTRNMCRRVSWRMRQLLPRGKSGTRHVLQQAVICNYPTLFISLMAQKASLTPVGNANVSPLSPVGSPSGSLFAPGMSYPTPCNASSFVEKLVASDDLDLLTAFLSHFADRELNGWKQKALIREIVDFDMTPIMKSVVTTGNLRALQALLSVDIRFYVEENELGKAAARRGHFNIFRLLHDHKLCTWKDVSKIAASEGHLDILKYRIEHGEKPLTDIASRSAARFNREHVLRYLHSVGLLDPREALKFHPKKEHKTHAWLKSLPPNDLGARRRDFNKEIAERLKYSHGGGYRTPDDY